MRRDSLGSALERVLRALIESDAHKLMMELNRVSNPERNPKTEALVRSLIEGYAKFAMAYQGFGPEEKKILKEFELEALADPSTWSGSTRSPPNEISLAARIRYALETFSRFRKIIQRDSDNAQVVISSSDKKLTQALPTRRVTFLIRELDSPSLTLKDLSSVISDIESIFQSIVKIHGIAASDLIVAALDSGSDKSIDLVGAAAAVEKLSAFLLEVWDRIRFARTTKIRASIKAMSEGLTLLTELKVAQDKGALSAEEGEKLKRTLLKSVDDLFLKGVYTSEMEASVAIQPSEIEFQRTKMLTHYKAEASESGSHSNSGGIDDASDREDED